MIHTEPLPEVLWPLQSVAVPLFFIISSFFFWRKTKRPEQISKNLSRFCKRNLVLYMFWFIALLIPTEFIARYYISGIPFWRQTLLFLRDLLFRSTFLRSWFIMANVIGMSIICMVIRRWNINNTLLILLSSIIWIICWLSDYKTDCDAMAFFILPLKKVIPYPPFSFLGSFLWISIGKIFADKSSNVYPPLYIRNGIIILVLSIFVCLEGAYSPSKYYITTIPLSIFLFKFILSLPDTTRDFKWCRKSSIIIYCTHCTICVLLDTVSRCICGENMNDWALFFITLSISCIIAMVIIKITDKNKESILRYAY